MQLCQIALKICHLSSWRKSALLWYTDRNRTVFVFLTTKNIRRALHN